MSTTKGAVDGDRVRGHGERVRDPSFHPSSFFSYSSVVGSRDSPDRGTYIPDLNHHRPHLRVLLPDVLDDVSTFSHSGFYCDVWC